MKLSKKFFGKLLILIAFCAMSGFLLPVGEAQAYFNPKVKESSNGNPMQCYALAYQNKVEHGTFMADAPTVAVMSTKQICAYVDSSGNMITGNIASSSEPSGMTSIDSEHSGKIKLTVGNDKHTISLYQCDDGGKSGDKCNSKLAKTWEAKKGANFKNLVTEINDTANSSFGDWTKMELEDNQNAGQKTEKEGQNVDYSSKESNCKASGGAKALGWIVCPVLEWMGEAAANVYNEYVEPSLQIEPQLFSGGNESVRTAWSTFQNFANIMFVILLLIVIFSQLTGVGIDNYGIKKILPKLILSAILINLSYLACLLMIDVSNILGNSFQGLFNGLSNALTLPGDIAIDAGDGVSGTFQTAAITGLTGVGVLGAVVATAAAIFANPAILLSMLVSALGIIIAVFFLFILLSAREAAIIVLTVISPLAVVAYILPNTKKLSDKWWTMFKGLLLVYPICGLLVGAGGYVSKLLLVAGNGSSGFISVFTSMIVSIVPIFFIPTVLKNSFAAMGNLGARISSFGQRVSGTTTSAARNSQAYRNAQELGLERKARIQAGVDANGNPIKVGRFGAMMRGGRRNMARQRAAYINNQFRRQEEDNLMGEGFATKMAGLEADADAKSVANAEAMLNYGKIEGVNTNDPDSMQAYHAAALARYASADEGSDAQKAAFAEVRAAQNIMSRTDKGRAAIQSNFQNAINSGQTAGLKDAASHIMSTAGDTYKMRNRGEHQMMQDLAQGKTTDEIKNNINNGFYATYGTNKYTPETLATADDAAIDGLINNMGKMSDAQLKDITRTANEVLSRADGGTLNVKPEVRRKIEDIARRGGGVVSSSSNGGGPAQGSAPSGYVERDSGLIVPH